MSDQKLDVQSDGTVNVLMSAARIESGEPRAYRLRTQLEQAMAHAESRRDKLRDAPLNHSEQADIDLVLLADEVKRLRKLIRDKER